jgi:hypothetical protein
VSWQTRHGDGVGASTKDADVKAGYWRLESGSLPGLSVFDIVVVDVEDGVYIFSKPGGAQVAALPVASAKEDLNPINGWVELGNPDQMIVAMGPYPPTKDTWASIINEGLGRGEPSKM